MYGSGRPGVDLLPELVDELDLVDVRLEVPVPMVDVCELLRSEVRVVVDLEEVVCTDEEVVVGAQVITTVLVVVVTVTAALAIDTEKVPMELWSVRFSAFPVRTSVRLSLPTEVFLYLAVTFDVLYDPGANAQSQYVGLQAP